MMKIHKSSKPIKMRLFVAHDRDKLTRDVEEFINLPEVRIIDIQFSMGYSDLEGTMCAYTVYYREHAEDEEQPTSDILQ